MDTHLLQLFVEVMNRRSFAAVARDHNVAPSSISRSIATLERELGVRLINRTTRRLSPTEAGEAYYERTAPLIQDLAGAHEAARDAGKQPGGNLRIMAPVGFAHANILPLLPGLSERYPQLTFHLVLTDENINIVDQRIDVAVRLWPAEDSSSVAFRLAPMRHVICASPAYLRKAPIAAPEDLKQRRCILLRHNVYRSEWKLSDRRGHTTALTVNALCVVSNALALKECALLGLGPALVPRWIVGEELERGTLVDPFPQLEPVATGFEGAAAWVVYPSRSYTPLKTRIFVDALKAHFAR